MGNCLTEVYYFSRWRWYREFRHTGWDIERRSTNRLTYTGRLLCGHLLSLRARGALSRVLGSSCHLFVLRAVSTTSVAPARPVAGQAG